MKMGWKRRTGRKGGNKELKEWYGRDVCDLVKGVVWQLAEWGRSLLGE